MIALGPALAEFADRALVSCDDFADPGDPGAQTTTVSSHFREHPVAALIALEPRLHTVDLRQFGAFDYLPAQRRLSLRRPPEQSEWLPELILGPGLLYALAHQCVFALHASALRLGGTPKAPAVALIAASGTGKSTLARAAHALGWERLADDVLPLALGTGQLELRPHFPQLKLPPAAQYPASAPERVPLAALLCLERGPALRMEALPPRAAADLVLRNTLASRLLPRACLAAHLQLVAAVAAAVSAGQLRALRLVVADQPGSADAAAQAALLALAKHWRS